MATGDLIDLDEAREFLQFQPDADEMDEVTESTITRASLAIVNSPYGREFTPTASEARDFEWDGCSQRIELTGYDIRTVSSVIVDPGDSSAKTLDVDEYRLGPVPARFGVYSRLEISDTVSLPAPSVSWRTRRVRVTGAWGFAEVPEDVKQACLLYVAALLRGGVQAFGSALQPNSLGEGVNDSEAFPPGVRGLLAPYARMGY